MARRRGLATALQAALGAAAGGLGGYAQQRELERKREQEKAQQERQTLMDTISLFEKGAFEAGPIATRAPSAPPRTLAAVGEEVKAPRPSMGAIPLAGVGSEAMQQAAAGLERYETGGPGAMTFELGGRRLALPSAATLRAEEAQDRLSDAIRIAQMQQNVKRGEEDRVNRQNYETYRDIYGKGGAYNPNLNYATAIQAAESARGRASAEGIARMRTSVPSGGAGGRGAAEGAAAAAMFSGDDIAFIQQFVPEKVTDASGRISFRAPESNLSTFDVKAAQSDLTNWYAGENEQRYVAIAGAVADAWAKRMEGSRLSNQDIDRFRSQVIVRPGDDLATKYDKFQRLNRWIAELNAPAGPARQSTAASGRPNNPEEWE